MLSCSLAARYNFKASVALKLGAGGSYIQNCMILIVIKLES